MGDSFHRMADLIPKNLGCIPDKPDSRDFPYEYFGAKIPSWEEGYDVEKSVFQLRDEHQDDSFRCVSEGSTADFEMTIKVATGFEVQLSQRDIYSQIFQSGGGSSPRDAYKLAQQKGVCEDSFLPSYPPQGRVSEEFSRNRSDATQEGRENALKWRIGKYSSISPNNWDAMAQAIFSNNGCGGGYAPVNGAMGHFVFFRGYGMKDGFRALKYRDSYQPYEKWLINRNGKIFNQANQEVYLFSIWTCEPSEWWKKKVEITKEITAEQVRLVWLKRKDLQEIYPAKNNFVNPKNPNDTLNGWAHKYGIYEEPEIFSNPWHITIHDYGCVKIEGTDYYFLAGPNGRAIQSLEEFKQLFGTIYIDGIAKEMTWDEALSLGISPKLMGTYPIKGLKRNYFLSLWKKLKLF